MIANDAAYIIDTGDYVVRVGQNAADTQAAATLTTSVEKTVSQCENVVPLDCELEEIKPALTLAKEETKWNLTLDLEKVSETKIFYTREHAQLVNAIAEKITMQDVLDGKYTLDELVARHRKNFRSHDQRRPEESGQRHHDQALCR